jgi:hypothetical protein
MLQAGTLLVAQTPTSTPTAPPAAVTDSAVRAGTNYNDTTMAITLALAAARHEPTSGMFFSGVAGTPWTIVSLILLADGEKPAPAMAVGPALVAGSIASIPGANHPLPQSLRDITDGHDSAYVASFRRTYNTTLSRRKGAAFAWGSLTGVAVGTAFLYWLSKVIIVD